MQNINHTKTQKQMVPKTWKQVPAMSAMQFGKVRTPKGYFWKKRLGGERVLLKDALKEGYTRYKGKYYRMKVVRPKVKYATETVNGKTVHYVLKPMSGGAYYVRHNIIRRG